MDGSDWRIHVEADSRQRIVTAIMETLKRYLPFSGQEEIQRIAVSFEEKIYTTATSQLYPLLSDYLRMISLNMLTMEPESQNPMANSLQSSAASNSHNPQDPDSLSQTGNVSGGDWQEETYQKIKSMNERYFPELNEMCKRMAAKLQQHGALPQQPKNEQLEKLKFLKSLLERLIQFLQTNKNEVQLHHKEKVAGVEKQIVNILNSNRPRKPVSSLQQGQLAQSHMQQSQQSQPQISQMHMHEGQMNSQMQQMNVQGSLVNAQQNNLTNLQHNSSVLNSRQNMMDTDLQPGSNIDPAQGNSLNQMQQVAMSSLQQNPVSGPQQMNINPISSSPLLQQQTTIDQQKQMLQSQGVIPEVPLNSLSQTGNASSGDWQEETYQKIKSMNERYFPELNEMCKKMAAFLQQHDALPQQPTVEQLEKVSFLKMLVERLIQFLQSNKNEVQLHHKDKIARVENQIVIILNSNRLPKPVSSQQEQSNAARNSINPQYPACQSMQSQMQNQVQRLPIQMVSHQSQMHTYGFGRESPDVIIAHLRQELSLKNSEIEELKSKNASLENMVSHLQVRVQQDEQMYHEMTHMMSQLNMLS